MLLVRPSGTLVGYLQSRFPEWTQARGDIQMEPKLGSNFFFFLVSKKSLWHGFIDFTPHNDNDQSQVYY